MDIQNQVPQNIEQAIEDYEKCNYQLSTLFDFSKDVFGILDIEVILKNSLLYTISNAHNGVLKFPSCRHNSDSR